MVAASAATEADVENLSQSPPRHRPRVIVKFRDGSDVTLTDRPVVAGRVSPPWEDLRRRIPNARVERLFSQPSAALASLRERTRRATGSAAPDLATFVAISLPPGTDCREVQSMVARWDGVEHSYVEAPPAPPPVRPQDDPRYPSQGHLAAGPAGIDAPAAWRLPGGDGRGIGFVDLEQGWTLDHEDLARARVRLISGRNQAFEGHGTAVLGVVLASDNAKGGIGIAPACRGRVVSEWRDATTFSTPDAIISAAVSMRAGDVLLLEAQRSIGGSYKPVEVELGTYVAILVTTAIGIVVVEAAGNGSFDLDTYRDPTFGLILKRGHADFRDSGAIMVGSCNSAVPHGRRPSSNYGSRIDCYAWGQNIDTTDGRGHNRTSYRADFSGTSGASAIVAGVAVSVQGMGLAAHRRRYTPVQMREILCSRSNGTASSGAADRIGVMPDLRRIVNNVIRPVGDFPTPRRDVRVAGRPLRVVLDPMPVERPNLYGAPSPAADDVTLEVGRRVADRLHASVPVTLTREVGGARTWHERELHEGDEAAVFVSLRAGGTSGTSDVWVHDESAEASRVLGRDLRRAMHRCTPTRMVRGRAAAIDPSRIAHGTAACMIAVDDPRALGDADGDLEPLADAVADGVLRYLGRLEPPAEPAWGDGSPALPDEADVPAQACFHEDADDDLGELPRAHVLSTPPEELRALLSYLAVDWSVFAAREQEYFTALGEHLVRAGTIPAGTSIGRANFRDAVRRFQTAHGQDADGIPGESTLWELQHDWAAGRRLAITRVAADKLPGSGGYDRFRIRADIVQRYEALRADVLAAGGVITSAGSMRDLGATVTAGRSATSMHYSGLAIDLATDTGMQRTDQRYIITADGGRWRVWCRSDSAPERTLEAVLWSDHATRTRSVTARAFDFTEIAERHGFRRIPPRSTFPQNYMSAEWWHFQCEAALVPWISQFGIELLSLAMYTERQLTANTDIWANRKRIFKRGRRRGWY